MRVMLFSLLQAPPSVYQLEAGSQGNENKKPLLVREFLAFKYQRLVKVCVSAGRGVGGAQQLNDRH